MINFIKNLMAKKKAKTIKVDLKAPNVSHTLPTNITEIHLEPEIKRVKYNNLEVLEVLDDGKETVDYYHCLMVDGTTMHVPKSLFN